MRSEDERFESFSEESPAFRLASRRRVTRSPPDGGPLLMYQASLLSLVAGLLAFALVGYDKEPWLGRFDVYWNICRYLHCSCVEPATPVPAGWPHLDLHAEGYTLRTDSQDLEVPRVRGELDLALMGEALSLLKVDFQTYSSLHLYVESGVPHGEVVRTMDFLESLHATPVLELLEPPGRDICLQPGGCVPVYEPHRKDPLRQR